MQQAGKPVIHIHPFKYIYWMAIVEFEASQVAQW